MGITISTFLSGLNKMKFMEEPSKVPDLCGVQLSELSRRETDNEFLIIEDSVHWKYHATIFHSYFLLLNNINRDHIPVNESFQ